MKVYKYNEFDYNYRILKDFFKNLFLFYNKTNEISNNKHEILLYKKIEKNVFKKLNIDFYFLNSTDVDISVFYLLVESIILKSNIKIDEKTKYETIILITMATILATYLTEKKSNKMKKLCKYILEELKLRGIGNGIIKKMMKVFRLINMLFSIVFKQLKIKILNVMDIFFYTNYLMSFTDSLRYVINKYNMSINDFIKHVSGMVFGTGGLIVKNMTNDLLMKIKRGGEKINIKSIKKNIITPSIIKGSRYDYIDSKIDQEGNLIKEN